MRHDPKVQQLPDKTFRLLINLWCVAGDNDGLIPDTKTLSFELRISNAQVERFLSELIELELVDETEEGDLEPHNWSHRQYKSDADPTARDRKQRQRDKQKLSTNVTRDTSVTSRKKNAPVTDLTDNRVQSTDNREGLTRIKTNQDKLKSPMSGKSKKPDVDKRAGSAIAQLNSLAGRNYQAANGTLKNVRARIKEGFSDDQLSLVIEHRVALWKHDTYWSAFLRPDTLFSEKFPIYLEQAERWKEAGRPQPKADPSASPDDRGKQLEGYVTS
jgi:uncharacterized phage protein (TIGR02220 family)